MTSKPMDGKQKIEHEGLTYVPHFISIDEAEQLSRYFTSLRPIWERRHAGHEHARVGSRPGGGRITRPVYWLGAWQFACLGYYSEPRFQKDRCVRAEPFPGVMQSILQRMRPILMRHDANENDVKLPNTCLINYFGSELGEGPPKDQARLRMHRDGEPGPVVMFCLGQAGLLEFLEPEKKNEPEISLWTRHRSVVVFSGPHFKDHLYHRLVQVRHGDKPALESPLSQFSLRRVSVSFRHIPKEFIVDFDALPPEAQARIEPYVKELAEHSEHFQRQLEAS